MTETPEPLTESVADRMVGRIDPDWQVRDATPLTGGHHPVAEVDIAATGDRRRLVLKATDPEGAPSAATEARVLRFLETESTLPVPDVIGAVDEQAGLPTPYFLMERLPGRKHPRTQLGTLDEAALSALARSAGRHLAELHRVAGFDAFGRLTHRRGEPLQGGRPAGTLDELTLDQSVGAWQAAVTRWSEQALQALAGGRFDELLGELNDVFEHRVADLEAPKEPVLAHIDWSLDNVLVDPASHRISGLPDWEFTLAATPGYDIVYATHSLAGGPWWWVPSYPDRRETIRHPLLEGYRESAPPGRLKDYRANRSVYTFLNTLHAMIHTVDRLELDGATADQIEGAIGRLRQQAATLAEG